MLETEWGQSGVWAAHTPVDAAGDHTFAGCTTIAAAQILFHYQYGGPTGDIEYVLDHDVTHADIQNRTLARTFATPDYDNMALTEAGTASDLDNTARFIYDVAVSMYAQFGDPSGSPASGKHVENAFRYTWGYNNISRRSMSIISKDAFGFSDRQWADLIRDELDDGRPVLYMAQQVNGDAGHAFVIDGYRDDGTVHVNWGWGGYANGYYDPNVLEDKSGRKWSRDAMIFRGLEPEAGFAAALAGPKTVTGSTWGGTGSLIDNATGNATGYGLTIDEAMATPNSQTPATAVFQWEVDASSGTRLEISHPSASTATITYGKWDNRANDRTYQDVSLPFVLDPSRDGYSSLDGSYFVLSVTPKSAATSTDPVTARVTTSSASTRIQSKPAAPVTLDGHTWNGNASIISYTTGTRTGYGITHDETRIAPSPKLPVVFFQWEIDDRDGTGLTIDAGSSTEATISYGLWNGDRRQDITRKVTLPYTIDPAADGLSNASGNYYVIKVAFAQQPSGPTTVHAGTTQL